jgi:hypothetical protein
MNNPEATKRALFHYNDPQRGDLTNPACRPFVAWRNDPERTFFGG